MRTKKVALPQAGIPVVEPNAGRVLFACDDAVFMVMIEQPEGTEADFSRSFVRVRNGQEAPADHPYHEYSYKSENAFGGVWHVFSDKVPLFGNETE